MLLVSIISLMFLVALFGRTRSRITAKGYMVIIMISLIQVALVLWYVYTMDRPPLM